MAHFWVEEKNGTWAIAPLNGDGFALTADKNALLCRADSLTKNRDSDVQGDVRRELRDVRSNVILLRTTSPESSSGEGIWVLISSPRSDIRVNGIRHTGLKHLRDRDEIRMAGVGRFYFSTERLAREESFPGGGRKILCGRCKSPIRKGDTVIRCPECGLWHHQSRESGKLCWTYASLCSGCACSTEILASFRWCPDGL